MASPYSRTCTRTRTGRMDVHFDSGNWKVSVLRLLLSHHKHTAPLGRDALLRMMWEDVIVALSRQELSPPYRDMASESLLEELVDRCAPCTSLSAVKKGLDSFFDDIFERREG